MESQSKFYKSTRHTIQQDPITYNDQIAELIGAKPNPSDHISIAPRYVKHAFELVKNVTLA